MRQKGFTVFLIPFVIVGLGLLVYFGLVFRSPKGKPLKTAYPTPSTTPSVTPDPTSGWKTYTNYKYYYEFKYPPESKLNDQSDNYVSVSFMGEKQKASGRTQTELFDGYAFNVADVTNEGYKDLDDFFIQKVNQLKDICSSIGDPKETTISGKRAITHTLSCLGDYDTYYVQIQNTYLEISLLHVGDTEDLPKYTEIVNQIFSTFRFTR